MWGGGMASNIQLIYIYITQPPPHNTFKDNTEAKIHCISREDFFKDY